MRSRTLLVVALLSACGGSGAPGGASVDPTDPDVTTPLGDDDDDDDDDDVAPLVCEPGAPSATPMRRLTKEQYTAAVWDAVDRLGGEPLDAIVHAEVQAQIDLLPDDLADVAVSREDQAVTQTHVDQWYLVAEAVADGFVQLDPLPCEREACVPTFLNTVGERLQRRPLTDEEHAFYVDEVYGAAPSHADGMRDLVLVTLASPAFPMLLEHGPDGAPDVWEDTVELSAFEAASRLSFHTWGAPPDDTLWALAESGELLDAATWAAEVRRHMEDPRAQGQRERFFVDWLQLWDVPELDAQVGLPGFDAFRGDVEPVDDLHERVRQDALDLIAWHVDQGSGLDALWTSDVNTTLDPHVAELYGAPTWDGTSAPQPLGTGHGGLLTRPAFTVTGTTTTRPIHKGVRIRRRVLCDALGDPPADLGDIPEVDASASARVRTEQLTEAGPPCSGCHVQINPLGYATESFDALGRFRTEETVFADDGSVLGTWPVDDAAVFAVDLDDDAVYAGHDPLAQLLADSEKPDRCAAHYWFRHAMGRIPSEADDACDLLAVADALGEGRPIDEALQELMLQDAFRQRRFDEEPLTTDGGAE
jgi:hypothetical protein